MHKRIIVPIFTLLGAAVGLAVSEILEEYTHLFAELPSVLSVGIYFTVPAVLAALGGLLSSMIAPIIPMSKDSIYKQCVAISLIIAVPGVFLLSAGAQKLYELSGVGGRTAVMVLDASSSMNGDAEEHAIEAAALLVDKLDKKDKIAMAFFGSETEVKQELAFADTSVKDNIRNILKEPVDVGILTEINIAIDTVIDILSDAEVKNGGIFVITDAKTGNIDDEYKSWIEENASLYVLNISGADNSGESLAEVCEASGGMYIQTKNPAEIETLYSAMFDNYYNGKLLLNQVRKGGSMQEWYYILIQTLFFLLLGAFMSASYTVLYNNKRIIFSWNVIMGVLAACVVELNNIFLKSDILMLIMFLIIYPTIFIGTTRTDEIRRNREYNPSVDSQVSEEGHIIR